LSKNNIKICNYFNKTIKLVCVQLRHH
jgi:hypothetical protein